MISSLFTSLSFMPSFFRHLVEFEKQDSKNNFLYIVVVSPALASVFYLEFFPSFPFFLLGGYQ